MYLEEKLRKINFSSKYISVSPNPFIIGEDTEIVDSKREVIFNQKPHNTDVFNRQNIETKNKFNGPAIIEESTATTVIPPNYNIVKDDFGNIIITKEE